MTKNEALKMAIEHLMCNYHDEKFVINACKEALEQQAQEPLTRAQQVIRANNTEQPTQEPVMISDCNAARQIWENNLKESEKILSKCKFAKSDDEQPAQEPVAIVKVLDGYDIQVHWLNLPPSTGLLYTHPHQWVGLTDNEIQELTHDGVADEYDIKFARAVLAKAKEKNYYGPT